MFNSLYLFYLMNSHSASSLVSYCWQHYSHCYILSLHICICIYTWMCIYVHTYMYVFMFDFCHFYCNYYFELLYLSIISVYIIPSIMWKISKCFIRKLSRSHLIMTCKCIHTYLELLWILKKKKQVLRVLFSCLANYLGLVTKENKTKHISNRP